MHEYPAVGAVPEGNEKCTFTVWAPFCKKVDLDLNNSIYPLTSDESGYWSATLQNIHAGAEYFFLPGGLKKIPDPASRFQPKGVHGPSSVVSPEFRWSDASWKGLSLRDMIIYEVHTGTFSDTGSFEGILQRLGYLKDLGINAIEIMPVAQFPGNRNWGYDGVFPYAVQNSYGGPEGLKKLVDAAHQHDIAVVLDVVYNHLGPEGNYLSVYGPYFTDKYKTPWGQAVNLDDAFCDGVKNFLWRNALMWLDEFHIDGLRLDAVHALWDNSARHFVETLVDKVRQLEQFSGRKKVLIAELDLNNPRYVAPTSKGGYGLDGQWVDEFHHSLHSLLTGETNGYYEDFGEPAHLAKSYRDSYVYTGQYSRHRKRKFGVPPKDLSYDKFVVFAQNHDQIGNRMHGDRLSRLLSFEGLKLAAAAYILSPHIPMLFMGEEYGEKNPFQFFISHTDEKLVELIRKGRREEFSCFNWEGEVTDPQSEVTFEGCRLSWPLGEEMSSRLLAYYKFLIQFRKNRKGMRGFERDTMNVFPTNGKKIIGFKRVFDGDYILMILNFEKKEETFDLICHHAWTKIFDSSSTQWNGPGEVTCQTLKPGEPVKTNPESVTIFELRKQNENSFINIQGSA